MLIDFERMKLASAALLLSPYIPMLFMGEEYGDPSPFYYFVCHSDKALIKAVQEGRKKEFEDFGFDESVPDPQDENTFNQCKLQWESRNKDHHAIILNWYKELINIRNSLAPLKNFEKRNVEARVIGEKALVLFRHIAGMEETVFCLFNFSEKEINHEISSKGNFEKILDSKESQWMTAEKLVSHPLKIKSSQTISLFPLSVVVYASF
jgi:maltooligosyltrehalose trehalohydrolase